VTRSRVVAYECDVMPFVVRAERKVIGGVSK
jgi:hypothetical protein